jgi:hypothetical protein
MITKSTWLAFISSKGFWEKIKNRLSILGWVVRIQGRSGNFPPRRNGNGWAEVIRSVRKILGLQI